MTEHYPIVITSENVDYYIESSEKFPPFNSIDKIAINIYTCRFSTNKQVILSRSLEDVIARCRTKKIILIQTFTGPIISTIASMLKDIPINIISINSDNFVYDQVMETLNITTIEMGNGLNYYIDDILNFLDKLSTIENLTLIFPRGDLTIDRQKKISSIIDHNSLTLLNIEFCQLFFDPYVTMLTSLSKKRFKKILIEFAYTYPGFSSDLSSLRFFDPPANMFLGLDNLLYDDIIKILETGFLYRFQCRCPHQTTNYIYPLNISKEIVRQFMLDAIIENVSVVIQDSTSLTDLTILWDELAKQSMKEVRRSRIIRDSIMIDLFEKIDIVMLSIIGQYL